MEVCDERVCGLFKRRSPKNVAHLRRPFGAMKSLRAVDHGFRSPGSASARCTRGSARAPRRGENRARSGRHDRRNSSAASDVASATILDYTSAVRRARATVRGRGAHYAVPMHAHRVDVQAALDGWVEAALEGESISREDALAILRDESIPLLPLVHAAGRVRERFFDRDVLIHQLHNVQSGACPEDCGYCGQSQSSTAPIQAYRLRRREEIIAEAQRAKENGAYRYCMVLSGRGPSDEEIDHMAACIREVKDRFGLRTCLSAGLLDEAKARRLADAGLDRLNHNLNTSESHYGEICTTHTFADRVNTLSAARAAGLDLCSGLIVGMGEGFEDLVEVASRLRGFEVPSIPVNFLVPIPGNRVRESVVAGRPITPRLALRVLCMFRFVNPKAEIRIGAGREGHLRSMQALALHPANSLFVDGYLLTRGSNTRDTIAMIVDAGFEVRLDGDWPEDLARFVAGLKAGGSAAFDIDHSGEVIRDDRRRGRNARVSGEDTPAALSVNGVAME